MKIYINRKPITGPWGGGAKTVNKLWNVLTARGHEVVGKIADDIDVIFCFDPRPNHNGEWYQTFIDYREKNPKTKIIQRVGDLGTHSKPDLTNLVKQTLSMSDYFIFPSKWAHDWIGYEGKNFSIIDNAPMDIFYEKRREHSNLRDEVSIVTHHWSTNPKKGFNLYKKFEQWCKDNKYSFHYIGQLPNNVKFEKHIKPVSADILSQVLPTFDIYLTASEEEAGANHVLEAMASGLPIVYKNSGGSIVDYCSEYGEGYDSFDELTKKIELVTDRYSDYKTKVMTYSDTNNLVIDKYCHIIEKV